MRQRMRGINIFDFGLGIPIHISYRREYWPHVMEEMEF
jgi:hypothetical protein